MRNIIIIISALTLGLIFQSYAQFNSQTKLVDWTTLHKKLEFRNNEEGSPFEFTIDIDIDDPFLDYTVELIAIESKAITAAEMLEFNLNNINSDFKLSWDISTTRKISKINCLINPIRYNENTKTYEQLIQYRIKTDAKTQASLKKANSSTFKSESLLKSGDWFKIKIDTTGIYKLTYSELKEIGLSKPENVRVYGYGGNQLSFENTADFNDDMVENPIFMEKGSDGIFNEGDYILFYSLGSVTWNYSESDDMFLHHIHNYSNYVYLFLTDSFGSGDRIETVSNNLESNYTSNETDKFQHYHYENYNFIQSGRFWFTDKVRSGDFMEFKFHFPNLIKSNSVQLKYYIAQRKAKNTPTMFTKIYEGENLLVSASETLSFTTYRYAIKDTAKIEFLSESNTINLSYNVSGGDASSESLLGYLCLNARESLSFNGGQYSFRDKKSVKESNKVKFTLNNNGQNVQIWDVTNPAKPTNININTSGNQTAFIDNSDYLKEYMAFDGSLFLSPIISGDDLGKIANQNLHSTGDFDMVIVTHPDFIEQANELADWRRNSSDPLSVFITTPDQIYNEFSSGTPDASAIRNFARMLYENNNNQGKLLKYLLLLGDGSYDNKTISEANSNLIPTFQNNEPVTETSSYVTDDFFGMLDLNDDVINKMGSATLDIGIGRFPVQTPEEAQIMIDKIKFYESSASMGSWRSNICFIGDDEDQATYVKHCEELANNYVYADNPEYNIDKIYLDAYNQVETPSGEKYPDVTKAINDAVKRGALIIDYIGHGNPRLLSHEEVLSSTEVRDWKNYDKLAVFVTASCEVGRFDDYSRTSMGEWIVLNPDGGGVASFTTTRVVYASSNQDLNINFFDNVFNDSLRLGDIISLAKNNAASSINKRNFSLLGDPSLKLAIPKNKVLISKINNQYTDTLNALATAKLEGYIIDANGDLLEEDGSVFITIFDKKQDFNTLENDSDSPKRTFSLQKNALYKGSASVTGGFFSSEIILPKDMNYDYGTGKISLYAVLNDTLEAIGYSDSAIIGGISEDFEFDYDGPEINLYMNDTTFISGGTANENPVLLAKLNDVSGINTSGVGIGHNITAVIDDDTENIVILNDFYQGNLNTYNSGDIKYPLSNVAPGMHTIKLKVWDIQNNSSEAELEFYVNESQNLVIDNIYNAPNPVEDGTWFNFEHNQANEALDIKIKVYDTMGKAMATIEQTDNNGSFNISPIYWDATTNNGKKLDRGLYIYKVEITTVDGRKTSKSSKMIIFR